MVASSTANPSPDDPSRAPSIGQGRETTSRPDIRDVLDQIAQFGELREDWDSYGGAPSSTMARDEARRWVEIVADLFTTRAGGQAKPYAAAPLADGGVQVEWRGPGGTLELEVNPDGDTGYLLTTGINGEVTYEEAETSSWSDILRLFVRIFTA